MRIKLRLIRNDMNDMDVLGAGLWPLLQMTLLPPLMFLLARWGAGRNANRGSL